MKKNILRTAMILMLAVVIVTLSACSGSSEPDTALTVGNAEVGSDVYAYFLDEVLQNKGEDFSEEDAAAEAEKLCVEYVKINSEFKKMELSLSSSAKAALAADVNSIWSMFGGYYESIGVSKQTLTNIKQSESYKEDLVTAIYGVGGEKEISEDEQKEYFNSNYVFFKSINAYLLTTDSDGKTVSLSEEELTAVKERFSSMKSQISGDTTIDAVNKTYEESNGGSAESEMPILSTTKGSDGYPEAFFADVSALENDAVEIFTYDSYIFLVQKKDGSSYFTDYAKASLTTMTAEDFAAELDSRYADLEIDQNSSVQSSCYKLIQRVKGK